jgi:hypothetical protein
MAKKLRRLEPRDLALVADLELEGAWRVEYFDSDGAGYVAIFAGQSAEVRARDYYDAIECGRPQHSHCRRPHRDTKDSHLFPTETTTASALTGF